MEEAAVWTVTEDAENQAKKRLAPPVMCRAGPWDWMPQATMASVIRSLIYADAELRGPESPAFSENAMQLGFGVWAVRAASMAFSPTAANGQVDSIS
jgi:hypothetical protein